MKSEIIEHMDLRSLARFLGTSREVREKYRMGKYKEALDLKQQSHELRQELARQALKDASSESYNLGKIVYAVPPLSELMGSQFPREASEEVIVVGEESVKDWLYIYCVANNLYRDDGETVVLDKILAGLIEPQGYHFDDKIDNSEFVDLVIGSSTRWKNKLQLRYAFAYLARMVEYAGMDMRLLCDPLK